MSRRSSSPQGQSIRLREVPVGSAAVYVPGGRAPYPSTVVMGVVTARAAGVMDVVVCAPPGPDGRSTRSILGTCRLCGVERVYRMGGAQAIAALAVGTESVRRVDVIVGPGNLYVQEAKHQLSSVVGIDGFAGPSDLMILLGAQAGEREIRLAALDMLAQGEHGSGSLVVGVCTSAETCLALAAHGRAADRRAPDRRRRRLRDPRGRLAAGRGGAGQRLRPRAPAADRRRGRGARAARPAPDACSSASTARRRSATTSRAPTTSCPRTGLRASPRPVASPLPPPYDRGADRSGGRQARRRGGADRPRRGIRGPRRVDGGPCSGEWSAQ